MRAVLAVIAAGTAVRLAFGAAIGLGIDESYMVAAGRVFRLGYFDHPVLSWWLSAGAAHLFGSDAALVVRLPFIGLFAISSWLMFVLTREVYSASAGLWAVVAFNLAPVFGVTTGGWVLPDGPMVCALLGFAICLVRALRGGWGWWLGAGLCVGLAMLSKYSAVLVVFGALIAVLLRAEWRRHLATPWPWVALAVSLLVFSPVVLWNIETGFASFAFQGGRAAAARFNPAGPLVVLAGGAAFVLPWIWAPAVWAWSRGFRAVPLLGWMAGVPVVLFAVVALWSRQVLFHWAAPGYLFMLPGLGAWLADRDGVRVRRAAWGTAGFVVLALAVVSLEVRTHALGLKGDPALQAVDWTGLRGSVRDWPGVIGATNWADTGKIDYALGGREVICLNTDAREYLFAPGPAAHLGEDLLIIAPRGDAGRLASVFDAIETLPPLRVDLPGRPGVVFPVFLGRRLKAWPPS